ncbi:MAG TPA: YCF48-related protein [Solirubrobacteraceae bacterium]|nr:YCF48-related protein [Solirubrobacteraceae bacterium]
MLGAVTVFIALAGVSAAAVNVSDSGWAWGNPTPQGRTLHAIAFSGGVGYAAGNGGTVLSTSNAGASWSGLTTGTIGDLESVQALSPSTVVVGGGGGCITRISTNGGQTFTRIFNVAESSCPEPVAAFDFVSAQDGFLLLRNGSLEATTDGGETFSRKTGIPGTPSSSGGGGDAGVALHFNTPEAGIVFVNEPSGVSSAYTTPDGGVSWSQVSLPAGAKVTAVHFVNATDAYAIGPNTLLRSTNGGETWVAQKVAAGNDFNSIDCASAEECMLTVTAGNELVKTTDGGATDTVITTSSSLIYGAAYASPTQIVAVGESGATVLSSDGGATFTPSSADIGGEYSRLRAGPDGLVLAPGAKGDFALSANGGQSWRLIATQTSAELLDVAFSTPQIGYALDVNGGLQQTGNGGASWQTLNPGTTTPARAVVALGASAVLLIGPVGIHRAVDGGRFEAVNGKAVASARLSDYDLAGSTVLAFGAGTHTLIRSTDLGASWRAIRLPLTDRKGRTSESIRSVAFTSADHGFLLDTNGRIWQTRNGGDTWREILSAGTSDGIQLAFSDPMHGFLSVGSFGPEEGNAYVLRTDDGGVSWHPQEITDGSIPSDGILASSALDASLLIDGTSVTNAPLDRLLFTTSSGGDVAGPQESLSLSTPRRRLSRRTLKAAHDTVTVNGTLAGAIGGEQIVVSSRSLSGGPWRHQQVVAGANGGSFTTSWRITGSSVFVAQWAGASGRPGAGSTVLSVTVR